MQWMIPGTVLPGTTEQVGSVRAQFDAMFLPGDLVLSQVCAVTGLEPYTVQNWIKRGFLPPPKNKRYNADQLCRLITINMLRQALPLESICGLISYINGKLDDRSDDLIADSTLYYMFLDLASGFRRGMDDEQVKALLDGVTARYQEPVPGAKARVLQVLAIMLQAWHASECRNQAEKMLRELQGG